MSKTYTKGNVIVEEIQIDDIHYEYAYGTGVKCKVLSKPELDNSGSFVWKSINVNTDNIISYQVSPKYAHYGPNLYDYEAYNVKDYI